MAAFQQTYTPLSADLHALSALVEEGGLCDGPGSAQAVRVAAAARGGRWKVATAIVGTFAALCVAGALLSPARAPGGGQRADVQATQNKFGGIALASAMASGLTSAAKLVSDAKTMQPDMLAAYKTLSDPEANLKEKILALNGTSKLVNMTEMSNMSKKELLKPEYADRHDGNLCNDDEEEHAGLCYQQCSALTGGAYPIRTTAWSCCMEEPCSFFNSKFTNPLNMCQGFDRAGKAEGAGCPHSLGSCMANEEFSLGMCYKKCAIVTENKFPYRSGAASCCRYNNHIACLDALNVNTSAAFNVGGGVGDGHNSTPSAFHTPMPQLAEA